MERYNSLRSNAMVFSVEALMDFLVKVFLITGIAFWASGGAVLATVVMRWLWTFFRPNAATKA
jgi:hypothetical protein